MKKMMMVVMAMLILCLCAVTVYAQDTGGGAGTTGTTMGTDMGDMDTMKTMGFDQRDRLISMLENRARMSPDMKRTTDDQVRRLRSATRDNWESVRNSVLSEMNR